MKVAVITDSAINQGLAAGRHSVDSVDVPAKTAIESSLGVSARFCSTAHNQNDASRNNREGYAHVNRGKVWIGYLNGRHYRFTGPQRYATSGIHWLVEHDFDRNTLHNLHVVTRRVLRRKQTETRTASGLDAIDVRTKLLSVQSIHGDFNFLAGPHPGYLVLFEIRGYPNVLRNQGKEALTSLNINARLNRFLCYPTRFRRTNFRIGLIQSGNRQIRVRLVRLGVHTFHQRAYGIGLSPGLADLGFIASHFLSCSVIGRLSRFRCRANLI